MASDDATRNNGAGFVRACLADASALELDELGAELQKADGMDWESWFNTMLRPLGYTWNVLNIGCESECAHPRRWDAKRLYQYALLTLVIQLVSNIAQAYPSLTSMFRCPPCNDRRGGVKGSRHLAETGQGKAYSAGDLQWKTTGPVSKLLPYLQKYDDRHTYLGKLVRDWFASMGLPSDIGIGVIIYGRRIHLDIRTYDYVEIKHDSGLPQL